MKHDYHRMCFFIVSIAPEKTDYIRRSKPVRIVKFYYARLLDGGETVIIFFVQEVVINQVEIAADFWYPVNAEIRVYLLGVVVPLDERGRIQLR